MTMAKRESAHVTVEVRQPDGTFKPVELVVHPPNMRAVRGLAASGVFERISRSEPEAVLGFLEILAILIGRTDPEHGTVGWLEENLEADDIPAVIEVVTALLGMERNTLPNAESPSPQR
jgi:hypothetical protein